MYPKLSIQDELIVVIFLLSPLSPPPLSLTPLSSWTYWCNYGNKKIRGLWSKPLIDLLGHMTSHHQISSCIKPPKSFSYILNNFFWLNKVEMYKRLLYPDLWHHLSVDGRGSFIWCSGKPSTLMSFSINSFRLTMLSSSSLVFLCYIKERCSSEVVWNILHPYRNTAAQRRFETSCSPTGTQQLRGGLKHPAPLLEKLLS